MPKVLSVKGFHFFFYSSDHEEPKHIHVKKESSTAKFWLSPVRLARSSGFNNNELLKLEKLVVQYKTKFEEAWDEYFNA